jgi:hypothetical protein
MAVAETTLREAAAIVRSKNAGPFRLTLDVIFPDDAAFEAVRDSGALDADRVAALYGVAPEAITDHVVFPAARAIKITMVRPASAGGPADTDVYGCQQHVPLLRVVVPSAGS